MLLSLWLLGALVAATSGWIALWAGLRVRRVRRRRLGNPVQRGIPLAATRALATGLTLGLALVTVADAVNRHFQYIPTFAAMFGNVSPDLVHHRAAVTAIKVAAGDGPTVADHGTVEKVTIPGPVSGIGPRTAYVYLPPQYDDPRAPDRRFPVLYLIHGSPGTAVDWLRGGYVDRTMDHLLRSAAIDPFIVVLPDVNGGYRRDVECQDVANGPKAQTYVVTDVVGYVDAHYRTVASRADRAIGGLSTGGYCGINLAFRHQDVFSAAVSHSGYGRPDHNVYTGDLFGHDKAAEEANTPDTYLHELAIDQPMGVYLDAGADDADSRRESTGLYRLLRARGVTTTLEIVKGESHDFVAFRQNLSLSLPWVSRWFAAEGDPIAQATVAPPDASYLPPPSRTDVAPAPRPCVSGARTGRPTRSTTSGRVVTQRHSPGALGPSAPCPPPPATIRRWRRA